MKHKPVFLTIWILFWIAVAIVSVELAAGVRLINPSFTMRGVTYELNNQTLFRNRPFGSEEIGALGNRLNRIGETAPREGARTVVIQGDSFIFGPNVKLDETISAVLQRLLRDAFQVINMGVVGYGPDQSLVQLQTQVLDMKPEIVVLGVFAANDFNDMYKNQLFTVDDKGDLVKRQRNSLQQQTTTWQSALLWDLLHSSRAGRPSRFTSLFRSFFNDIYDLGLINDPQSDASLEKKALMRGVLRRYREILSAHQIPFLAVIIPPIEPFGFTQFFKNNNVPPEKWSTNEDIVAGLCRDEDVDCLNLYPLFAGHANAADLFDPVDHHLSPKGYHEAAGEILRTLRLQGDFQP